MGTIQLAAHSRLLSEDVPSILGAGEAGEVVEDTVDRVSALACSHKHLKLTEQGPWQPQRGGRR